MTSINKSFLYGICFASVTWIISLYLYLTLTKTSSHLTEFPIIDLGIVQESKIHVNSERLIGQLQPVMLHNSTGNKYDQELSELGLVKSSDDQRIRDDGYKKHAYNVLISNQLSLHRDIPDTRNELCRNISYPLSDLPTASIIICFYNEHYRTLLRTVHSIIDRTPASLLHEIVLVDDYSDLPDLHDHLKVYFNQHIRGGLVKLLKTDRREGLIRARIFGAAQSKGKVVVFLDSHVEVNVGWIEPLLMRIKENRSNVVMPVIDIINSDTFAYSSSPLVRGGFNWGLHFKWENLPKGTLSQKADFIKPIQSPTMAGGLFAINRKYFTELGEYDAGMNIWGGENLEISFRIWMCGGQLELIPCSRVGHIFRRRRPYGSPDGDDTMLHNSLRVAHVWMDDYKEYFLKQRPGANKINYGDTSSRIQLRKDLKCQDFDWYLKTIYPQLTLPTDNETRLKQKWAALERDQFQPWHSRKRNYIDQFQLRLRNTSLCIQSAKDFKTKGTTLILKSCMRSKNQVWHETDKSELVLGQLLCLQAGKPSPFLYKCHETGGDQEWKHKGENNTPIYNIAAGTCLAAKNREINALVTMRLCKDTNFTVWDLIK